MRTSSVRTLPPKNEFLKEIVIRKPASETSVMIAETSLLSQSGRVDPRTPRILAKTIYKELRQNGLSEQELMSLTSEFLQLIKEDVRSKKD